MCIKGKRKHLLERKMAVIALSRKSEQLLYGSFPVSESNDGYREVLLGIIEAHWVRECKQFLTLATVAATNCSFIRDRAA